MPLAKSVVTSCLCSGRPPSPGWLRGKRPRVWTSWAVGWLREADGARPGTAGQTPQRCSALVPATSGQRDPSFIASFFSASGFSSLFSYKTEHFSVVVEIYMKLTISTIVRRTVRWHEAHSRCRAAAATVRVRNACVFPNRHSVAGKHALPAPGPGDSISLSASDRDSRRRLP